MNIIKCKNGLSWNPNETVCLRKLFLYKCIERDVYNLFLEVSCQVRLTKQYSWPHSQGEFTVKHLHFNDVSGLDVNSFGEVTQLQDCEILDHSNSGWERPYEFITEGNINFHYANLDIKDNADFLKSLF